jgi:hypothetical protein
MKKFVVSEYKNVTLRRESVIEAVSADEARAKFEQLDAKWSTERVNLETRVDETMGSQMIGGNRPMDSLSESPF